MNTSRIKRLAAITSAGAIALGVAQMAAPAQATVHSHTTAAHATTPAHTTRWESRATRTGSVKPATKLQVAVWLKMRNTGGLDKATHAIFAKGSGSYHQWLTPKQVAQRYDPTKQQVSQIKRYLADHGMKVTSVAGNRAYVNATGTAAQASSAFKVHLAEYKLNGHTYRGTTAAPRVSDLPGHVASISGLDTAAAYQPLARHIKPTPSDSTTAWKGLCGFLDTTNTVNFDKPTASSQTLTGFLQCSGYSGDDLQRAYGVDKLTQNDGVNTTSGAGQTIAIVDAYGSNTIRDDANAFSTANGLPALTTSNFQIIRPAGIGNKKDSKAQDPSGWATEVAIDVEAAHAMAPGANIVLVAAPNDRASLDEAVNWVTVHHLANIVTSSWGLPFDLASPGQGARDERIFQTAAAEGIGENFSTGDDGDNAAGQGQQTVDFPATSPWVNAVGGTSLFMNEDGTYNSETGWGDTFYRLATCDTFTTDSTTGQKTCTAYDQSASKVLDEGFIGGAGGGLSNNWAGQPWQTSAIGNDTAVGYGTVGTHRAIPDVSMVGDPETGLNIWITDPSVDPTQPTEEQWGGTSLSSPLFAGVMADVDQARAAAGDGPAGLASQYLYGLSTASGGPVRDATQPVFDNPNPSAAGNPESRSLFYGSFVSGSLFNVGFNADTSLGTTSGWDDVTGVGTPYAPAFVNALQ